MKSRPSDSPLKKEYVTAYNSMIWMSRNSYRYIDGKTRVQIASERFAEVSRRLRAAGEA